MTYLVRFVLLTLAMLTASGGAQAPLDSPYSPVPEIAQGPQIPEAGYRVETIGRDLYVVNDGFYLAMFMVYDEGVVVVNAPQSLGANLLAAIRSVTEKPVTHFIYTHAEADHVGAAALFEGATYIAQEEAAARLERASDPARPVPSLTFADNYTLTVGDQTLELRYWGNSHAPGSIFVYAPEQKALMVVNIVLPGWAPFVYLNSAEDVPGFIEAHEQILSYDFDTFVGGHWNRVGTREDVELAQAYVLDLRADALEAVKNVTFGDVAARVGFSNPVALVKAYNEAQIDACAQRNLSKWLGRLGGVDVAIRENCHTMI